MAWVALVAAGLSELFVVLAIKRDTVMAQVEMACGPYRIVSLMSREAADELGLEPGSRAEAVIKATGVVIETR